MPATRAHVRMPWLLAVLMSCALVACSGVRRADVSQGFDLAGVRTAHVVRIARDERGTWQLIANALAARGMQVSTGTAEDAPPGTDVLVTYQDRWTWDVTMYMSGLDVQLRDPKTQFQLASGAVSHPSLDRERPETIVKEVFDEIFMRAAGALPQQR